MTFFALHRGHHGSLATDRPWLRAEEVSRTQDAIELLQRLEQHWQHCQAEHQQALEQARAAGFEQGRAEALAAVAPRLIDAWDQAARHAQGDVQTLRDMVAALAVQVTERLAHELAPADVVAALARRASQELLPDSTAVLRVHPDVAQAVSERMAQPAGDAKRPPVLEVRADATLEPLDCVFDTPAGALLAGLRGQLSQVMRGWSSPPVTP
jgi:type III secretion protein L